MAGAEKGVVPVASYVLSRRGKCESGTSAAAESFQLAWDAEKVCLSPSGDGQPAVAAVSWAHVATVWSSARARTGKGFQVEVAFEIDGAELDFLRLTLWMSGAAGEFMGYLQLIKAERLKEERLPSWVMSQWPGPLYRAGVPAKRLRVALGWVSTVIEVLFAVLFFLQLQKISEKRGEQVGREAFSLLRALGDIWDSVTANFVSEGGAGLLGLLRLLTLGPPWMLLLGLWRLTHHSSEWLQLLVLLQHFFSLMLSVQSFWSTGVAVLRSLGVLRAAAGKAKKSLRNLGSTSSLASGKESKAGKGESGKLD